MRLANEQWHVNLLFNKSFLQPMTKFFIPLILLFACTPPPTGQSLVDAAIATHGSFENKKVTFTFREREYAVIRNGKEFIYTRSWQDSLGWVEDKLVNSSRFSRTINGEPVEVSEEWSAKYSESVNSVLYFFQIPFVLNDPAAYKKYLGKMTLKGQMYHTVEVTFSQEGGGQDFDDVFMYWIHPENFTIDFLAYKYATEGGGVRFREAINRREISGLLVQDYVNYEAPKETPLLRLPVLFSNDELKKLSEIINENVVVSALD
jgi:hypothetical protein